MTIEEEVGQEGRWSASTDRYWGGKDRTETSCGREPSLPLTLGYVCFHVPFPAPSDIRLGSIFTTMHLKSQNRQFDMHFGLCMASGEEVRKYIGFSPCDIFLYWNPNLNIFLNRLSLSENIWHISSSLWQLSHQLFIVSSLVTGVETWRAKHNSDRPVSSGLSTESSHKRVSFPSVSNHTNLKHFSKEKLLTISHIDYYNI